jgi:hypothetical protein
MVKRGERLIVRTVLTCSVWQVHVYSWECVETTTTVMIMVWVTCRDGEIMTRLGQRQRRRRLNAPSSPRFFE